MFRIKSKYIRMEYDESETALTALISLKHCELTKEIKWRILSKDKKDLGEILRQIPKIERNTNIHLELGFVVI